MEQRVRHFRRIRPFRSMAMPTVNDDFNRTVTRLDLDPELSGIFTPGAVAALHFSDAELMRFNDCVARVAPGRRTQRKAGAGLGRHGPCTSSRAGGGGVIGIPCWPIATNLYP
jgi:hypothetical protein